MDRKVKFALFLSISFACLIIVVTILNTGVTIKNPNLEKTATIINEITPYETEYIYDSTLSSDAKEVVEVEGENGLQYTYDGINYVKISDAKKQVVRVGTGKKGTYDGKLTSYGPDCKGCSAVGNVACATKSGAKHSLKNDGMFYKDDTFGSIRILAADTSAFPCGTVIKVNNGKQEFLGVVLDTGGSMRNAWAKGNVWIDLAFTTESEAKAGGMSSNNAKFVVQRWGW